MLGLAGCQPSSRFRETLSQKDKVWGVIEKPPPCTTHMLKHTKAKKEGLALDIGMEWMRGWAQPKRTREIRNKARHLGKHDGSLYQTGVSIHAQGELETELAPVEGAPNPAWPDS